MQKRKELFDYVKWAYSKKGLNDKSVRNIFYTDCVGLAS